MGRRLELHERLPAFPENNKITYKGNRHGPAAYISYSDPLSLMKDVTPLGSKIPRQGVTSFRVPSLGYICNRAMPVLLYYCLSLAISNNSSKVYTGASKFSPPSTIYTIRLSKSTFCTPLIQAIGSISLSNT